MVCITSRLHSTEFELRFCAGSNPALGVSEVCHGENFQLMPRMSDAADVCITSARKLFDDCPQFIVTENSS